MGARSMCAGRFGRFCIGLASSAAVALGGLASAAGAATATDFPVRRTDLGQVQGLAGDVMSFRGIPYAAPPVGGLRWKPPQRARPWAGVRPATQFGSDCFGAAYLRKGSLAPGVSEDCLYLNVWAPSGAKPGQYPVMVWVYGGGFAGGTAAMPYYDGEALARQGVVVVTFNYRTNILGFFAHPGLSRESPTGTSGNYGLLDILAALRWVQGNARAFGGDPGRVTVFGESAGASAIGLLLTSPLSKGLFRGAILESPGLTRPLATLADSAASGERFDADLSRLRSTDPVTLMARADAARPASRDLRRPRPTGPIVDGHVLPQTDSAAIAAGRLAPVRVLIGTNADEGRAFLGRAPMETSADYQAYLEAQFGDQAAAVAACYPLDGRATPKEMVARIFGDNQFNRGVSAFSEALVRHGAPVWRYRFNGNTEGGRAPATHGAEIPYVFGVFKLDELGLFDWPPEGPTPADRALGQLMSAAWVRFAKNGDPAGDALNWPAYATGKSTMAFGPEGRAAVVSPGPSIPPCADGAKAG